MELVGRANQELRWAAETEANSLKHTDNVYWARSILKQLILPALPGTLNTESAVEFVNGDSPTKAFHLSKKSNETVSLEPTKDVDPHEIIPLVQLAESYRQNDTLFGSVKLVGVRAMILAVPNGGKLRVNQDGIQQWLEEYNII